MNDFDALPVSNAHEKCKKKNFPKDKSRKL